LLEMREFGAAGFDGLAKRDARTPIPWSAEGDRFGDCD
jgi:hypothetical protein